VPWRVRRQARSSNALQGMSGGERRGTGGVHGPRWAGWAGPNKQCIFYLFKLFPNGFKFETVTDGLLVLKIFSTKYGHVYN
jgi:hypothetical protein